MALIDVGANHLKINVVRDGVSYSLVKFPKRAKLSVRGYETSLEYPR